jgi:hypothetical protein
MPKNSLQRKIAPSFWFFRDPIGALLVSSLGYGFGINYKDIFTKLHLAKFGLKSVDLKYNYYKRDSGLHYSLISAGLKFIQD